MKSAKIIAVAMAAALSAAMFSGCTAKRGESSMSTPGTETVPPAASDVVPSMPSESSTMPSLADESGSVDEGLDSDGSSLDDGSLNGNAPEDSLSSDSSASRSASESSMLANNESVAAAMSADFSQIGALSGRKDTGFPGGPVDAQNRPGGPISYQQKLGKYGAYFIVPDSQKIYLTFDEGYENGYTSRILDILKEKNVKAVFFITYPYAKTESALVSRMIAEGHTLGNHSTKHLIFPDMPLEEAAKDIMNLHEYVLANYGYKMSLFRPPEGAFSEQTLALAQQLGYSTVLWSFAYKDYDVKNQPIGIEATASIVKKAHPGEICLLHAVSRTNAEILGDAIDQLRAKGFAFSDTFYFK